MNHTSTSAPSPARGRGLQATRAVRPGDIIGIFTGPPAAPVIAIPDSQHLDDTCSHCLATAATLPPPDGAAAPRLRACTACRAVVYCSPACQKRDWQLAPHKLECGVFQRVVAAGAAGGHRSRALPTPVRALVQILLRDESSRAALVGGLEGHGDAFRRSHRVAVGGGGSSSSSGADDESTTSWQDMELQAMGALHYLGRPTDDERAKTEAVEILCKLQVNSFNRLDADTGQTGLFLHPALAMANHSCLPNAYVQFSGRVAVLRAYQAIEQGQEVEISYIDQALPLTQRQASLKTRYHFTCSCPRCRGDLDVYQACRLYPRLDLNSLSLAPDLSEFLQQQQQDQTNEPSQVVTRQAHAARTSTDQDSSSSNADSARRSTTKQDLSRRWRLCQPLSLTTKDPYPHHALLHDANIYFASHGGRYASSLALSSLLATRVEPVRQPFPDSPPRAKGLLMLAKLLANVAEAAAATAAGAPPTAAAATSAAENQVLGVLAGIDVPTTCEVLLRLVLRSATAPLPSSSESSVSSSATVQQQQRYLIQPYHVEAREMLADLESLPGRTSERGSVRDLFRESQLAAAPALSVQERLFLDMVIVKPLREVAGLAETVMQAEFGAA